MKPKDYFPKRYLEDFTLFVQNPSVVHGPAAMLCGWTMGNILEPKKIILYHCVEDFLCCLYALNLLHQGIHCYFPEDYYSWCHSVVSFPDCQDCMNRHGGISRPYSIILFAENPSFIPQARAIKIDEKMLMEYTQYFFS